MLLKIELIQIIFICTNILGLIKIISMKCENHFEEIRFVCRADNCYYLPLCQYCLEEHSKKHKNNEFLPLSKATQLASNNLLKQKQTVDDLLQPFAKRKKLTQRIEDQKKELKRERDRLVKYIDDYINQEVNKLVQENSSMNLSALEKQLEKDLEEKLTEINELLSNYKQNPLFLQKSLNLQLQKFMENLSKSHTNLYGTNQFKYYSSLTHEIMLSKLQLTSQNTITKPIRKIMNESPLYFLIDSAFNTSNYLFNFNTRKQEIKLYNAIDQQWSTFHAKEIVLNQQGCAVHDPVANKFFWIGGTQSNGRKSNSIIIYSLVETEKRSRWIQVKMRTARSSCMASLIKFKDLSGKTKNGILIVGGLGENGEILKSCQYLDLATLEVISFGQTNFATFSGTLLVYNNSTVLRLGGLSKNKGDYTVVEVVEKLDCQQALNLYERQRKQQRWSYIELQLPKGEYLSKPKLFYANQASIQINPNEIFVFGGLDAGMKGVAQSYLIGVEEFTTQSRQVRQKVGSKQQRFSVRWVNEKPLISGDDFSGVKPIIWKQRLYTLQNMGSGELISDQKRLLQFDMYQWYETQSILPD